jgi:hypothetical protein
MGAESQVGAMDAVDAWALHARGSSTQTSTPTPKSISRPWEHGSAFSSLDSDGDVDTAELDPRAVRKTRAATKRLLKDWSGEKPSHESKLRRMVRHITSPVREAATKDPCDDSIWYSKLPKNLYERRFYTAEGDGADSGWS